MGGQAWPLHEIPIRININNRLGWVGVFFNIKVQVGIGTNLGGSGTKLLISRNATKKKKGYWPVS